jgi:hypothetical protein
MVCNSIATRQNGICSQTLSPEIFSGGRWIAQSGPTMTIQATPTNKSPFGALFPFCVIDENTAVAPFCS